MDDEKVKVLFENAESALKNARKQLYQPAEDVVNYSVCVSARTALQQYLNCLHLIYVRDHHDDRLESPTMKQLIDYCSRYNDELKSMDFSSVNCKCRDVVNVDDDDIFYCNDVFVVKHCTELAEDVRELVMEKA